tara:strand:- start:175 stop:429 length:255 start_codon:yes stop_codon:yes gene_type:complete
VDVIFFGLLLPATAATTATKKKRKKRKKQKTENRKQKKLRESKSGKCTHKRHSAPKKESGCVRELNAIHSFSHSLNRRNFAFVF